MRGWAGDGRSDVNDRVDAALMGMMSVLITGKATSGGKWVGVVVVESTLSVW